jgi:hypothetical protein
LLGKSGGNSRRTRQQDRRNGAQTFTYLPAHSLYSMADRDLLLLLKHTYTEQMHGSSPQHGYSL